MQKSPARCTVRQIVVSPREIHILRFIMEAYEGLCVVSTLDPRRGLMQLAISPGSEDDIEIILASEGPALGLANP